MEVTLPIDVTTPNTPGWWMQQLWKALQAEQPRLARLDAYSRGEPQIVIGTERLQSAYYRFQNMARTNYAKLIVSALTNRMSVRAIRTSASTDDNGDVEAWRIWTANGLNVAQTDLYRLIATFGVAYTAIGAPTEAGGEPVITVEDPRQVITAQDPLQPWRSVAAFKLYHDPTQQMDYAILWLPGQKWVAQRPRKARPAAGASSVGAVGSQTVQVSFSPSGFDLLPFGDIGDDGQLSWAGDTPGDVVTLDPADMPDGYDGITSETYALQDIPVVRYGNQDAVGEFELHTDLLDRIAHVTLQQMVIATLQAFKQRAIQIDPLANGGDQDPLPDEDENGNPIDYNEVFEADPGALWRLPIGAKIWESGQVDLTGIAAAQKFWVLELSAASETPLPAFSPDSANQSANGADLYREQLTFKVEDRERRAGNGHSQTFAIAFKLKGDVQRGNSADIICEWAPADRYSILDMAQADSLSTLPPAQKFARFYQMPPDEVKIAVAQLAQQQFQQAALAAANPQSGQQPQSRPEPLSADVVANDDSAGS